jgi:hypothetical protein
MGSHDARTAEQLVAVTILAAIDLGVIGICRGIAACTSLAGMRPNTPVTA